MRQMRHFFLRFGISSLGWQKPSPPSKNAKSVAFCHTDDPGSAGRPCASLRTGCARFSLPLDGGKTGTPDLIRPGLVELPCNPSPIPLRSGDSCTKWGFLSPSHRRWSPKIGSDSLTGYRRIESKQYAVSRGLCGPAAVSSTCFLSGISRLDWDCLASATLRGSAYATRFYRGAQLFRVDGNW